MCVLPTPPSHSLPSSHRDDLQDYDPFDDGGFCRSRFWLFISYIVSFASVVGAVWVLMQHYGEQCWGLRLAFLRSFVQL